MEIFVQFVSLAVAILTKHSSCKTNIEGKLNIEGCDHYTAIRNLWSLQKNSVTMRSNGIKEAMETLKTCGPTSACTACYGTHPFDQTCPNAAQCSFQYLTISADDDVKDYTSTNPTAYAKVAVDYWESTAETDCQNFVNTAGNPFHGGISATLNAANVYPQDNDWGIFRGSMGISCEDMGSCYNSPGGTPHQIDANSQTWCVSPPPPNQAPCGDLANYVDRTGLSSDFAIYALKG